MIIIKKSTINDFVKQYPEATSAFNKWYTTCKEKSWKNHAALKEDFLSADYVGNERYVFNIKGK